jgi:hypothetical protein
MAKCPPKKTFNVHFLPPTFFAIFCAHSTHPLSLNPNNNSFQLTVGLTGGNGRGESFAFYHHKMNEMNWICFPRKKGPKTRQPPQRVNESNGFLVDEHSGGQGVFFYCQERNKWKINGRKWRRIDG